MSETVTKMRAKLAAELRARAARKYPMPLTDPPPDDAPALKAMYDFATDLAAAAEVIEYGAERLLMEVATETVEQANKIVGAMAVATEGPAQKAKLVKMRISIIPNHQYVMRDAEDRPMTQRHPTGPASARIECACGNVSGWTVELVPAELGIALYQRRAQRIANEKQEARWAKQKERNKRRHAPLRIGKYRRRSYLHVIE